MNYLNSLTSDREEIHGVESRTDLTALKPKGRMYGNRLVLRQEMTRNPDQALLDISRLGDEAKVRIGRFSYAASKLFAERKIVNGNEVFGDKLSNQEIYAKIEDKVSRLISYAHETLDIRTETIAELIYPTAQHFFTELESLRLRDKRLTGFVSIGNETPAEISFRLETLPNAPSLIFVTSRRETKTFMRLSDINQAKPDPKVEILSMEVQTFHHLITNEVGFACSYILQGRIQKWFSPTPCKAVSAEEYAQFFQGILRFDSN